MVFYTLGQILQPKIIQKYSNIQSWASREVCFGSLSMTNLQLLSKNTFACVSKYPSIIWINNLLSIFSLKKQIGKTPIEQKAAQTFIFEECLVVGLILFWSFLSTS